MGTPDSETLPGFTSFSEEFGFEPNRSPIKVWGFCTSLSLKRHFAIFCAP